MIGEEFDSAFESIIFLQKLVGDYLQSTYGYSNLFFPDAYSDSFENVNCEEIVDVILLGSFARSFLESGNLPFKKIRFWCVSQSVKNALVSIFKISSENIGLISREQLLENQPVKKEINPTQLVNFVYAGRLCPAKNIELLIETVHALENNYKKEIQLHLIGDFDHQEKIYVKSVADHNYEESLKRLISQMSWKNIPIIYKKAPQAEWMTKFEDNQVFVSLTTNVFEDFGVSVFQVQKLGWPCILSDWGGHKDVASSNTLKIPYSYLSQMKEDKYKASILSKFINEKFYNNDFANKVIKVNVEQPKSLAMSEFDLIRKSFMLEYGPQINLVLREKWNELILTKNGIKFYCQYRSFFVGDQESDYDVAIVSDYFNDQNLGLKVQKYLEKLSEDNIGVVFISFLEVSQKPTWKLLLNARKIHYLIENDKLDKTKSAIESIVGTDKFLSF